MGLFNNFPYMDLSNLNLDFILKKLKDLTNYAESAESSAARAESAKDIAVMARDAAEASATSAQSSARDAQLAETSAENYAAHIADPVSGLVTTWLDDNIEPTTPPVDASLTIQGAAADAKATGDELDNLRTLINQGGMSDDFKAALDDLVNHIGVWIDGNAQMYIQNLHDAMYPTSELSYITAVYTQSGVVYDTDSLDDLKPDLVVTAHYSDLTTRTITSYVLSGELTVGTSTITVTYGGKTTTFTVTVSEGWDFEWSYVDGLPNNNGMTLTNSGGTISLGANGLSVSTTANTSSNVIYKYETLGARKTQVTSELVFEVTSFTELSGGGVRHYAGRGGTGGSAAQVGQFLVAADGIKYLSGSSWATLYSAALSTNTEYTMRIVQTASNADVYLNGSLVGSLQTFEEVVAYPQFTAHRGASALFKSYKLKWTA